MLRCRNVFIACLMGLLSPPLVAQTRTIQGTVRDSLSGEPLGSGTVLVRGTRAVSAIRTDGTFSIANAPSGDVVLSVRSIGYRGREVPVSAATSSVAVSLGRDVFKIEELVVTGTATGTERRNVATAVATVGSEDLNSHPTASLEQQLQGKVAGAEISTNSGAPGGGVQIRLRGITSVNATAAPLYVVDGVIASDAGIPNNQNVLTAAASGSSPNLNQDVVSIGSPTSILRKSNRSRF